MTFTELALLLQLQKQKKAKQLQAPRPIRIIKPTKALYALYRAWERH